jgi:hypothetical protein
MTLYDEFYAITGALNRRRIPYAVVGGLALMIHARPRFTKDIDILINTADLSRATAALDAIGYTESAHPWTFENTQLTLHRFMNIEDANYSLLDLLVCNDARHAGIIKHATRTKFKSRIVRVARVQDLIWLKEKRNSDQDKVDIKMLSIPPDKI